jgi:hypothetical protein
MPYLNWREQILSQTATPSPADADYMTVTLTLTPQQVQALAASLQNIFTEGSTSELRLDLPNQWVIFWKQREGESRLLIAHPQAEEWVTTAALLHEHACLLLDRLRDLASRASHTGEAAPEVVLSELAPLGSVSNAELKIRLA